MKKLIYAFLALLFIGMLATSLYYIDKINRKTHAENLTKKSDTVSNAIKYSPQKTTVMPALTKDAKTATLSIKDEESEFIYSL